MFARLCLKKSSNINICDHSMLFSKVQIQKVHPKCYWVSISLISGERTIKEDRECE